MKRTRFQILLMSTKSGSFHRTRSFFFQVFLLFFLIGLICCSSSEPEVHVEGESIGKTMQTAKDTQRLTNILLLHKKINDLQDKDQTPEVRNRLDEFEKKKITHHTKLVISSDHNPEDLVGIMRFSDVQQVERILMAFKTKKEGMQKESDLDDTTRKQKINDFQQAIEQLKKEKRKLASNDTEKPNGEND